MEINIKKLGIEQLMFESGYIISVVVCGEGPVKYIVDEIFDLFDDVGLSGLSVSLQQDVSFQIIQRDEYTAESFWNALNFVKNKLEKC